MKRKGLIFLFIFVVLILPNLVFASNLNDNIILEEVNIEEGRKVISWELKENVSPGSYFLLDEDYSLEDYDIEKDDFLDLEIVEDSGLLKLIFIEELEEGQEGSISFIEKEKINEVLAADLPKGKNVCDICNLELNVIEDGRPVCICEEAVIIDLDDMPLNNQETDDEDNRIENNEADSEENLYEKNDESVQELESPEKENELRETSENIISENPKTLPNTGFSEISIFLGLVFLFLGVHLRKKLLFK